MVLANRKKCRCQHSCVFESFVIFQVRISTPSFVSRAGVSAMDGRSWSSVASTPAKAAGANESSPPLYLVPFVFWMNKPASVLQGVEERARGSERSDCRVTVAANSSVDQA